MCQNKSIIFVFFLSLSHRIVRNRDQNKSSPITDNHNSSSNVYTIHSLLNHSQYEYSKRSRTNGNKDLFYMCMFVINYSDISLVLLSKILIPNGYLF